MDTGGQREGGLRALRRYAAARAPVQRCELCSRAIAPEHQHLVDPERRELLCCCDACAILFSGGPSGRLRRVPRRARALADFELGDAQWEALGLPINLAFFFHSSPAGRVVAIYPGPAGATEALPPLVAWGELVARNPALAALEPDAEALLVSRVGQPARHLIAPIDACYGLVGLLRTHWRGLSGGPAAWAAIARFFDELQERAYA